MELAKRSCQEVGKVRCQGAREGSVDDIEGLGLYDQEYWSGIVHTVVP